MSYEKYKISFRIQVDGQVGVMEKLPFAAPGRDQAEDIFEKAELPENAISKTLHGFDRELGLWFEILHS